MTLPAVPWLYKARIKSRHRGDTYPLSDPMNHKHKIGNVALIFITHSYIRRGGSSLSIPFQWSSPSFLYDSRFTLFCNGLSCFSHSYFVTPVDECAWREWMDRSWLEECREET